MSAAEFVLDVINEGSDSYEADNIVADSWGKIQPWSPIQYGCRLPPNEEIDVIHWETLICLDPPLADTDLFKAALYNEKISVKVCRLVQCFSNFQMKQSIIKLSMGGGSQEHGLLATSF